MTGTRRKKNRKTGLKKADFAGDGGPYSEVIVKISIRILDGEMTRSRLAVNVYPDPALERMARESLQALGQENYGYNEHRVFGACLSENFNGWEDMNRDYPRINDTSGDVFRQEDAKRMNAYIAKSVEWAITLNKMGMEEAARNEARASSEGMVM
jgi:hypothetical protein